MKQHPKPIESIGKPFGSQLDGRLRPPRYGVYCLVGIGIATLWTAIGCGIALVQHTGRQFFHEWILLQGFPLTSLGAWLLQIIRSRALEERIMALTQDDLEVSRSFWMLSPWGRVLIIFIVGAGGTTSLIALGFNAKGAVRIFMWLTCAAICTTAGFITVHAMNIVLSIHRLQYVSIRLFRYSPAQTRQLKDLVTYFTSFTLLMTAGYGFALAATLYPDWNGSQEYITAVRIFWPLVYVPTCTIAMIYPHFVVHKLIQREKDHTLSLYHRQIDTLLAQYEKLTTSDVDRTNTLAQLFDRISATPNYVLDFGTAVRTFLPIAFNVATLVAKAVAK